ncbi:MAG: diguanylate cyclase [Nitrospirota bacterium]
MNRAFKHIFIASCVVALLYPLVNVYFIFPSFRNFLTRNTEDEAVRLANHLAPLVMEGGTLKEPHAFSAQARTLAREFNLEKLKVFAPTGEIIYSTDPKDIGTRNKNSYFFEIVAQGKPYTKVVQKGTKSLEGQTIVADVVETYAPIMINGRFAGAFEIYYDITKRNQALNTLVFRSSLIPLVLMMGFLVVIVAILFKAQRAGAEYMQDATKTRYLSPAYQILVLALSIFVAEIAVMLLISAFPPLSVPAKAVLDASLLVLLISPSFYFFLLRPLLVAINERRQAERELSESKQMLEDIAQGITESILLLSKDFKILWANKAALEETGLPLGEILNRPCYEVTHRSDHLCVPPYDPCPVYELIASGNSVVEHIHFDRDGNRRFVEVSAYPLKDKRGEIVKFVHISKDITERKVLEEGLLKKSEQVFNQSKELQKINAELHALYEVSKAISRTLDLEKLLSDILQTITGMEMFRVERKGMIFLVEGSRLHLVAHTGLSETAIERHKDLSMGESLSGLVATSGEPIISKNSDEDARHQVKVPGLSPCGHIILPLKAKDKVFGVLCLYLPPETEVEERILALLSSVGNQIGIAIQNARLYEETRALSLRDPLTGIGNRRLMDIELERSFAVARRYDKQLSILMLDIDHFKEYNDRHGHAAGDAVLAKVAGLFTENMREADYAFRYGGEEFTILLPETDTAMACEVAERIRKAVEKRTEVTVSIGIASYQEHMKKEDELVRKADNALYQAKNKGRNRVEVVL